ncbi:MAG: NDP-sugar synthase [Deltaproteobacteria bacterium]|nr:NDP-sugar synthase [Deltaproteobacteria bacterium]
MKAEPEGAVENAIVLAAGYGERLKPLSLVRPKPLVPLLNRPLLDWVLDYLFSSGIRSAAVNAHHLWECIRDYTNRSLRDRADVTLIHEPVILGTGGGIKNCARHLAGDGPFLVMNADVVTDLDLGAMASSHVRSGAPATLALHDLPRFNSVSVSGDRITAFAGRSTAGVKDSRLLAFTGIHLIERDLLADIPEGKVDIISVYRTLIDRGAPIHAFISSDLYWEDLGSLDDYRRVHKELLCGRRRPKFNMAPGRGLTFPYGKTWPQNGVTFEGWACVGQDAVLGRGCHIADSLLWNGVRVDAGVQIRDCIVTDGATVSRDISGRNLIHWNCAKR